MVKRALQMDEETNTWQDAIRKEMKAVDEAFECLDEDSPNPVGHKEIECHMAFDTKADFSREARFVAGSHMTCPPVSVSCASVVSHESVRIAFLVAALNDLDIVAADIGNAHLNAPVREKTFIACGPEFGPMAGRKARIVHASCGSKSSGAAWRSWLAQVLHELDFEPCRADNDVWIKPSLKRDGSRHCKMVLVCTDDILCVLECPKDTLCKLDQHFPLKPDSTGEPKQHLGALAKRFKLPGTGKECWAMGSAQHVKEAVRNVKGWLDKKGLALKTRAPSVLPMMNCRPELDTSLLCDDDKANCFHQQTGALRWPVELRLIDTCAEVSMPASFCAAPQIGHLCAVFHMCAYLANHERSHVALIPIASATSRLSNPTGLTFAETGRKGCLQMCQNHWESQCN